MFLRRNELMLKQGAETERKFMVTRCLRYETETT